jgi:hypothetical protein
MLFLLLRETRKIKQSRISRCGTETFSPNQILPFAVLGFAIAQLIGLVAKHFKFVKVHQHWTWKGLVVETADKITFSFLVVILLRFLGCHTNIFLVNLGSGVYGNVFKLFHPDCKISVTKHLIMHPSKIYYNCSSIYKR